MKKGRGEPVDHDRPQIVLTKKNRSEESENVDQHAEVKAFEDDDDGCDKDDEVELDIDGDVDTDEGENGVEQTTDGNAENQDRMPSAPSRTRPRQR